MDKHRNKPGELEGVDHKELSGPVGKLQLTVNSVERGRQLGKGWGLFNFMYRREIVDKYWNNSDELEGIDPKELVDQSESSN